MSNKTIEYIIGAVCILFCIALAVSVWMVRLNACHEMGGTFTQCFMVLR